MKTLTRILTFVLALLMVLAMMPAAFAVVLDEEDTYMLERPANSYLDPTETRPNMQYASIYSADYTHGTKSTYIQPVLYSLYHTTTGEVIPTYCLDIDVSAKQDIVYRRMNLEDSSYSSSSAGLIRAIVYEGFYINGSEYATDAAHEAAIDAQLAALGAAAGVENLTLCEAISATQCALWQAAHGTALSFSNFVRSYVSRATTAVHYRELCNEEYYLPPINGSSNGISLGSEITSPISDRIRTVYDYLLSLKPKAPNSKVASPSSFTNLGEPIFTANGDGTYTVSITTTVNVQMASGDDLTLKASLGNASATKSLKNGQQTVTLTLPDIPAEKYDHDVTLTISGYQTASDVFLFDAEGGRGEAQTMVALSSGRMPVFASVIATPERVLHFYKTTKNTATRQPLEGIIFDIYPVATLEDYLSGAVDLPEPEDYTIPKLPEYTVITDKDGKASFSLTHFGLPDGVYLVVERDHPAIKAPVKPFYVIFPMTNSSGTGYEYEITVQPKNEVKGGVRIDKGISSPGTNSASVDAYAPHTWVISATVPEDIAGGKSYKITDTLDNRLDYLGNLKVNLETADGETVVTTLTAETDYTLTVTDVDSLADGNPSDSFVLALTTVGMGKVAGEIGTNHFDNYNLRVYFDAQVNANAEVGTDIPNQADLKYVNSVNITFSAESDKPVVYTGGANLLKVDANDNTIVLPGAVFEVYRAATAEEVAANGSNLVYLDDVPGAVVKVSFFDTPALEGEKVSSVTSGADGTFAIYGLAYGTYYLVETQAPAGYSMMQETIRLPIDDTTHTAEKVVILENRAGAVLPETGGIGTTVYTLSGILMLGLCVLLILMKKHKASA